MALLTAGYKITDLPLMTDSQLLKENEGYLLKSEPVQTNEIGDLPMVSVATAKEINPAVLGYSLSTVENMQISKLHWQDYVWASLLENIFSSWFWLSLLILIILLELYHRYRDGSKFWEKTLGFRIF